MGLQPRTMGCAVAYFKPLLFRLLVRSLTSGEGSLGFNGYRCQGQVWGYAWKTLDAGLAVVLVDLTRDNGACYLFCGSAAISYAHNLLLLFFSYDIPDVPHSVARLPFFSIFQFCPFSCIPALAAEAHRF